MGTTGVTCVGPHGALRVPGNGFKTPSGTCAIASPGGYQANNSEVMAVLLDVESWPGPPPVQTINQGHARNPKRMPYLNAKRVDDTIRRALARMGSIAILGNPYIITLDLNKDDKGRDAFYSSPLVSQDANDRLNNPQSGLNGHIQSVSGMGPSPTKPTCESWSGRLDRTG